MSTRVGLERKAENRLSSALLHSSDPLGAFAGRNPLRFIFLISCSNLSQLMANIPSTDALDLSLPKKNLH